MLLKREIPTARSQPITPRDIWVHLSWAPAWERFLLMEAATGGHHIVMAAPTTLGPGHTVVPIGVMATIIRRLTTITIRELMAGNRVLMDRTGRRRPGRVTILTRELTREGLAFRLHMAAEVPRRLTTPTQGPMPKRGKALVLQLNGAAPMSRVATRAPQWVITQPRTVR